MLELEHVFGKLPVWFEHWMMANITYPQWFTLRAPFKASATKSSHSCRKATGWVEAMWPSSKYLALSLSDTSFTVKLLSIWWLKYNGTGSPTALGIGAGLPAVSAVHSSGPAVWEGCEGPRTCQEEGSQACAGVGRHVLWGWGLRAGHVRREGGWDMTWLPSAAAWGGDVQREVLSSSPWDPVIWRMGAAQSCARGGSDRTLESFSLQKGWSNPGTGFLERQLMPHASQCWKGIWTMSFIACFSFWSALQWSGSWTGWSM